MQLEWDPRVNPHQPRSDWFEHPQPPVAYSTSAPTMSMPSSSSSPSSRRRSSVAHIRPAGPPPNLPIPSLPPSSTSSSDSQDLPPHSGSHQLNGRGTHSTSFTRPGASTNHTAIANFSQIRQTSSAPVSQSPLQAAAQADDLSDPPPPSVLPSSSSRMSERSHESGSSHNRHLSPHVGEHRPSSRRALTRALELAREAVQLDSTNEDPEAAVNAYAQSVALLSEVMERVRRGEDSTESRRGKRRRSVAAQEEEVRRLQNIHDTYADRMNILSIIYSIPPVPYSASSLFAATHSVSSTNTNSPTHSGLPSTENSPLIPQPSYTNNYHFQDDAQYNEYHNLPNDGSQPIGSPITLDESVLTNNPIPGLPSSSQHPYATAPYNPPFQPPQAPQSVPIATVRAPSLKVKPRVPSQLPPAPPPPSNSLPPAPTAATEVLLDATYSHPFSHPEPKPQAELPPRGMSGLTPLEEEADDAKVHVPRAYDDDDMLGIALDTPRNPKRDSHPLPPIPSPTTSADSSGTPRTSVHIPKAPSSPRLPNVVSTRSRSTSAAAPRPEPSQPTPIINSTTAQGAIHQRRSKTSLPSRSASPDSTLSAASVPSQKQPQHPLPAVPVPNISTGRGRSYSQPGRRPSLVSADQRPPLPPSAGPISVKPSFPPKTVANPSGLSPGEIMSPPIGTPTPSFLPPPSMTLGVIPFVPTSPLPPPPPSDPLRQPYHMMNLLAASMASPGGYITRRLHVPNDVWAIPGVKLSNVPEKIRVLEILLGALEDVQTTSSEHFGAGNVSSGMAMGIGSIGGKEANAWLTKLDEFSIICDSVVASFGKKLGVGEGFVLKKTTWSDKLIRRFDKFTNGKNNVDSPTAYMQNLKKLFQSAQLLDEHTKAVMSQPVAPAYAAFPSDIRASAEQKLRRASEFFASVVLTFVIRDLAVLLDKYVKKCEKLLQD
ncbi:hypothetical protein P691DRAFT_715854 [Macrolepiota fuliginosa MF-IS2]|uniref:MIT domain-containing protein n=1 Tax=Macrolepiota fuliginosa MF-IS2 TaxID=1400762 RepID=A0A9P6CB93_9AGAR|nr:hypothetical protein P691DRAFT_715854 [Macrolepiota fuliginosa MF-IS2]